MPVSYGNMIIRELTKADYHCVQSIYLQGIQGGDSTFETTVKDWKHWDATTAREGRLVAVQDDIVVGYAILSDVSSRCVYSGVAENSVYVDNAYQNHGHGFKLLKALIDASEKAGYWTLEAQIFVENKASIHLHEKAGFQFLCVRQKLAKLNGIWRDVAFLERRSTIAGQD